ncbi:hypothetical protein NL676_017576 [Syzygium grande]|nr:hypothetical protein NL676_017576 [Syzygium grande]
MSWPSDENTSHCRQWAISSFLKRASSYLHGHPACFKALVLVTLSSGSLVAYSDSQSETDKVSLDLNHKEQKKKKVVVLGTGWAVSRAERLKHGVLWSAF